MPEHRPPTKPDDRASSPVLWAFSCAGLLIAVPMVGGLLLWLWTARGDGVQGDASQLERAVDEELLTDAVVEVDRRGDGPFPPRTITKFEATAAPDADPDEVGAHIAELRSEHDRIPDLTLENGTEIRDIHQHPRAAELPAEGWADVLRLAEDDHVDEVLLSVGDHDEGSTVRLHRTADEREGAAPSSSETLAAWADLDPPRGSGRMLLSAEGGTLRQSPADDEGSWSPGESDQHPDYDLFTLDFMVEADQAETAVALLEAAQEEDRWDRVSDFSVSLSEDEAELSVTVSDEAQQDDPVGDAELPPEMVDAAEDYAELAQGMTEQELDIQVGLFDTQPSRLMAEHESS